MPDSLANVFSFLKTTYFPERFEDFHQPFFVSASAIAVPFSRNKSLWNKIAFLKFNRF
jgi:hypothetical protein